jgi:hypothetical protein
MAAGISRGKRKEKLLPTRKELVLERRKFKYLVPSPEGYQPPQYLSPRYDDNDDDSTSQPTQRLPCLCNADEYSLWTSPA